MKRRLYNYLVSWKDRYNRKPLIVRGARQVGKTYLIRQFGEEQFAHYLEINFDESPQKAEIFESGDIKQVLEYLSLESGVPIVPGRTLIFLDEIQRVPWLFAKLRYFYEKVPDIHIIAAGSLLDIILAEHEFAMPVGRVEYLFMGPMDFPEFLESINQREILNFIRKWEPSNQIPLSIHEKLVELTRTYTAIGGMPSAVDAYIKTGSFQQVEMEQTSIIQTCRDDFSKYGKKIDAGLLRLTLEKIPQLIGRKVKYVEIDRDKRAAEVSSSIKMLQMARLLYCVHHSAGNSPPLSSEKKEKDFKPLFLDVGLMMSSLNMNITGLLNKGLIAANNGVIAEQFIGQHLLYSGEPYKEPQLFYWNREKRGAAAEIDYLIQTDSGIIPVEVKAGVTGTLKSLHVFIQEKSTTQALRFNLAPPSNTNLTIKNTQGHPTQCQFLSLPLYFISETERLCSLVKA